MQDASNIDYKLQYLSLTIYRGQRLAATNFKQPKNVRSHQFAECEFIDYWAIYDMKAWKTKCFHVLYEFLERKRKLNGWHTHILCTLTAYI